MKKHYILLSVTFLIALALNSSAVFGLYETTDPWPMHRYDLARSGSTPSSAPNNNKILWSWTPSYLGEPVVADGRVIVTWSSKLYALDETTGVKLWESISFPGGLSDHIAVAYGRVYVGSYSAGYLYCVNATNGAKIWDYEATTSGYVQTGPAVADGKVYFGTTDNYLYALNAYTKAYIWRYTAGGPIYSHPAIDGDMLYFGCDDDKVYALNISGTLPKLEWQYPTAGNIRSAPCVGDGKVFFGSSTTDHAVFAVNKTTGQKIWKYVLDGTGATYSPALSGGLVFFYQYRSGGKVYALYANATPGDYTETDPAIRLWSTPVGGYATDLVVADGKVFLYATDGNLYALDATNGLTVWTYTFSAASKNQGPIVADGRVFLAHYSGLYCFGGPYPPVTYHYTVTAAGYTFDVKLVINATPGSLDTAGLITLKKISYTLEGIPGTTGMSNITIPNQMLGGSYTVTVDGGLPSYEAPPVDNGTHTSLYFTYLHSTHTVEIEGTTVVPEFPLAIILPLLITISLIAVTLAKKKLPKK